MTCTVQCRDWDWTTDLPVTPYTITLTLYYEIVHSHQQWTPAHAGHQHDGHQLADHLKVVGRAPAVLPAAQPSLQQGTAGQRVADDGDQQGQQPQHGEHQRWQHVAPVLWFLHVEEAPAPGALDHVGPLQQHRQQGHQGGEQPGDSQQPLHVVGSQHRGVEDRPGDADAALHRHGAAQEQGAQAEEHHACPEDNTQGAVGVECLPFFVGAVDEKHQGAIDEVTQQVCHHQAAGKEQEGRLGLDPYAVVGFDKDEEGEAVGEDAHRHGDGRGGDGQLIPVCVVARPHL